MLWLVLKLLQYVDLRPKSLLIQYYKKSTGPATSGAVSGV